MDVLGIHKGLGVSFTRVTLAPQVRGPGRCQETEDASDGPAVQV